jgi:hypothetical protein
MSGRRGRQFFKGHFGYSPPHGGKWRKMVMGLKRPEKVVAPQMAVELMGENRCDLWLATVHEFMTLEQWPGGDKRRTGALSLFFEDGVFKCWVNDKDAQRSATLSAPTLGLLLLKVEEKLAEDTLEWRKARPEQGRAGRK